MSLPDTHMREFFDDHDGAWDERHERSDGMRTEQAGVWLGFDHHELAEWFAGAGLVEFDHPPLDTAR